MTAIIAYHEKTTLAGNELRREWRIRPVESYRRDELDDAWGSDWQKYRPHTTHVLEERFIRNGVDEGWNPRHTLYEIDDAVQNIDENAVIVDVRLARIASQLYAARDATNKAKQAKAAADLKAKQEAAESDRRNKRSLDAFEKLRASPKDRILAERWNAFIIRARDNEALKARIARDPTLYNAAAYAETVPAKRKAIREFLEEFDS